jgi:AcrR family transcriptional regulator
MTPPPPPPASGSRIVRGALAPDKREAILDAALQLFVSRGFHGTTVPEVAERAGVGAGTIYRYFSSKEELGNELYRHWKGEMSKVVLDRFPIDAPARDQFHALWTRLVRFYADAPTAFWFLEVHHHADYLDERSHALEQRMTDFGVAFIQAAQAKGQLKKVSPLLLIGLVLGAFTGVVRKASETHMELDEQDWRDAEQCAWEAIRI